MKRYIPAIGRDGVSLARACRFSALVQDVVSGKMAPRPAPAQAGGPVSLADQAGAPMPATLVATAFDLYASVVEGGRFAEFAAIVCVSEDDRGVRRDVTEEEAAGEDFPAAPFGEAFALFLAASGTVTRGLLGMPPATAPTSQTSPEATTDPTTQDSSS